MSDELQFVYAQLNARVMPLDRGERYEDPLQEALESRGLGEVTGGGTMQATNGEIEYCGLDIDIDPTRVDEGLRCICETLSRCGAPKGSKLLYERDSKRLEAPFGEAEGLAIYLNGTDLPDEVYANCDVNDAYDEINRLIAECGQIQGHWQGPTETALYLYGASASEMEKAIANFMREYPLCHRARVERIA